MAKQERIWDWDVLRALYLGGMELKEIVTVPRFAGLSLNYLKTTASDQKWRSAREAARAESTGAIARPLIAKMGDAEAAHQGWLLDTLERERRLFDQETRGDLKGGKNQLERLKIINSLDETVRRQLGLDERKPVDDQSRNLGILIQLQSGQGQNAVVTNIQIAGGQSTEKQETVKEREKRLIKEKADAVAAEILAAVREGELAEPPEKPLPPGIKAVSPFKVKGDPAPVTMSEPPSDLVNESPQEPQQEQEQPEGELVESSAFNPPF